jgi:hypothetical protein
MATIGRDAYNWGKGNDAVTVRCYGFRVGTTAGDVRVTTEKGTDIIITNVQSGETVPLAIQRVWETNTTAEGIIGYLVE